MFNVNGLSGHNLVVALNGFNNHVYVNFAFNSCQASNTNLWGHCYLIVSSGLSLCILNYKQKWCSFIAIM